MVTGGAVGIDKGIALRLAEAGASIILTGINMDTANKTSAEMKAAGYKVKAVQADSSKLDDIDRVVAEAISTFSDVDILVNNAGISLSLRLTRFTPRVIWLTMTRPRVVW
ncbi:SDR family NAD(P)-dependent oxidoreductase [Chloroflexota bacterium]